MCYGASFRLIRGVTVYQSAAVPSYLHSSLRDGRNLLVLRSCRGGRNLHTSLRLPIDCWIPNDIKPTAGTPSASARTHNRCRRRELHKTQKLGVCIALKLSRPANGATHFTLAIIRFAIPNSSVNLEQPKSSCCSLRAQMQST